MRETDRDSSANEASARAQSLRREFDDGFAQPPQTARADVENLLSLHLRGDAYALRLDDIAGLAAIPRIVAVPSPVPGLLGLAGLRGALVPVYALAALLGYPPAVSEPPRWIVLVDADRRDRGGNDDDSDDDDDHGAGRVGLAFERFDGYLQVARAALVRPKPGGGDGAGVARVGVAVRDSSASIAGDLRPVIDVRLLVQAIKACLPRIASTQPGTKSGIKATTKES